MSQVLFDVDDAVCTITLNAPERRNAVDGPMAAELLEAFERFEADDTLAVAILHGSDGTFCAGADLTSVGDEARRPVLDADGPGPMGPSRMALSKPLIAAVSGYAVAGGLELSLHADLRVVEEDAICGVFCRRWGVPLIDGGTVRLPRIIGHGRALDLILTGRPVRADEALQMGLANRVVPVGESLTVAHRLAEEIAEFPQKCMRADRASAIAQWDLALPEALRAEGAGGVDALLAEGVEGAARFSSGAGRHGQF
jgi:enoyl-CoA hydratase